jgi:hypothetical protein
VTNYVTIAADSGRRPRTSPHYHPRSERRKRKRQAPRRCLRDEEAAGSNPTTRPRNMQVTSSPCDRASALRSADVRFWDALGAILSPILGVRFWEPILRPPPPCPNRNCLMAGRLAKGSGTAVRAHLSRGFAQRIVGRGRCHRRSPSWLSLSRRVRAAQCRRLVGPRKTPSLSGSHHRCSGLPWVPQLTVRLVTEK